jgi:hypothetical protein
VPAAFVAETAQIVRDIDNQGGVKLVAECLKP